MNTPKQKAIVLVEKKTGARDKNICKILDFLGIPWQMITVTDCAAKPDLLTVTKNGEYGILCSSPALLKVLLKSIAHDGKLPAFVAKARSVYVYQIDDPVKYKPIVRFLTRDRSMMVRPVNNSSPRYTINKSEVCGPMSGLTLTPCSHQINHVLHAPRLPANVQSLIAADEGDIFLKIDHNHTSFFLNTCADVIDIDACVEKFDIKNWFGAAVPLMMYLKWFFRDVGWHHPFTGACIIVDDPLLHNHYGYFDYHAILKLMKHYDFTVDIAFIPWNWRRTHPSMSDLLNKYSDKFSLSVHGCDHTAGEFSSESIEVLNNKIKLASQRMQWHQKNTKLKFSPIMVFPQGVFSVESVHALKHNNYTAAVNTVAVPSNPDVAGTEISELWHVAITKYAGFPVFTRRYPDDGLENIAFDILLGKPCLIVTHHEFYKNNNAKLISLIDNLNTLPAVIQWRNLSDVLCQSYQKRWDNSGNLHIRMFANSLILENPDSVTKTVHIEKKEVDADGIQDVKLDSDSIGFRSSRDHVRFQIEIPPHNQVKVCLRYRDIAGPDALSDNFTYRLKTMSRRYLSEFRDNYICKNDLIYKYVKKIKQHLLPD